MSPKRILFLQRAHPRDARARESLDAALVAAIFEQSVTVLFRDEGVLQLSAEHSPSDGEFPALIESLPEYGVQPVFACQHSLTRWGLEPDGLLLPVSVIGIEEQSALIAAQQAVIND